MESTGDENVEANRGFLLKRKDFLGVDRLANSHPNRTYYYRRKDEDVVNIIETSSKKLLVFNNLTINSLFPMYI